MTRLSHAKIVLLRHGQCEGGNILRGKTDVNLSELGAATMLNRIKQIDFVPHFPKVSLISSPLQRCQHFTHGLFTELNTANTALSEMNDEAHQSVNTPLPAVQLMPELAEIDFGDWDGVSFDSLYEQFGDKINQYWDNPWQHTPPNAEPMSEFETRVASGFNKVCQQLRQVANSPELKGNSSELKGNSPELHVHRSELAKNTPEPLAIIVTHGGVIRTIIALVLGLEQCQGIYNTLSIDYAAAVSISVFWADESSEPKFQLHWSA
ncbi:histidine phosphatase family protein [Shewanella japonica]|uniref:histidine phosphatase family protein n=1 Tax=Shewanella japonica TaxID=93973 RepID=UPI0013C52F7C|nr:histidine phosphatase family protein [Shewanella japonica]